MPPPLKLKMVVLVNGPALGIAGQIVGKCDAHDSIKRFARISLPYTFQGGFFKRIIVPILAGWT